MGKENLELTAEKDIKVVAKLKPSISQGVRKDGEKFDYNKDAGMFVCPGGIWLPVEHVRGRKIWERISWTLITLTLKSARYVH